MEPMEIYIADVPFDKGRGSKVRPALVIEIANEKVIVFKVTSQYENKSSQIKKIYYPIKEWRAAGLKKQSYVDTHKLYRLAQSWVFSRQPIGKLTDSDRIGLFEFIKELENNKN
ncbi:type II toxin-antitoxin system PemK/MazF family toxin [Limosilactobacillus reuteri]|uniref:type II toxin-antitoxin system PemK/MazF family toxin n=1 Tax=Limosilactobacillus reuteri TaxID=1598 RepID=UPI001E619262|nr:type II toxin-antitoxin system PemK/MazF family toxin [Limosilactobacillus reuteri]MCC4399366.1 type II toxin-antitoxin system PemK/MazF family toxin [Limosilactobacillus reuteri]MCC4403376.1 type II toxin-antitoxin system PemK/MazF family toxin [Limosilactobacillus reuteri]